MYSRTEGVTTSITKTGSWLCRGAGGGGWHRRAERKSSSRERTTATLTGRAIANLNRSNICTVVKCYWAGLSSPSSFLLCTPSRLEGYIGSICILDDS
jgi:hypothetical protein